MKYLISVEREIGASPHLYLAAIMGFDDTYRYRRDFKQKPRLLSEKSGIKLYSIFLSDFGVYEIGINYRADFYVLKKERRYIKYDMAGVCVIDEDVVYQEMQGIA